MINNELIRQYLLGSVWIYEVKMQDDRYVSVTMGDGGILAITFLKDGTLEFPSHIGFYPDIKKWDVYKDDIILLDQDDNKKIELHLNIISRYRSELNFTDSSLSKYVAYSKNNFIFDDDAILINDIGIHYPDKSKDLLISNDADIKKNINEQNLYDITIENGTLTDLFFAGIVYLGHSSETTRIHMIYKLSEVDTNTLKESSGFVIRDNLLIVQYCRESFFLEAMNHLK